MRAKLVAVAIAAACAASLAAVPSAPAAAGACSKPTATQLVADDHLNDFLLPDPVVQVLCGPFTGPGSTAMAVTIGAATCWSPQRWALFSLTGGTWQLVHDERAFLFPLTATGGDIIETVPVFRAGDPRCLPSGGRRSRTWHYDGTRLVSGPFSPATGGQPVTRARGFIVPGRSILCVLEGGQMLCQHEAPPVWSLATVTSAGRVTICQKRRVACVGDPGEGTVIRPLTPGHARTLGPFRCTVGRAAVTCVVARTGRGFRIGARGVRRL